MNRLWVHLTVVLGILVNLVKAGDLILRPHQQRRLQQYVEELALRLSYTEVLKTTQNYLFKRRMLIAVLSTAISLPTLYLVIHWAYSPSWMKLLSIGSGSLFSARVLMWVTGGSSYRSCLRRLVPTILFPLITSVTLVLTRKAFLLELNDQGQLPLFHPASIRVYLVLALDAAAMVPVTALIFWVALISLLGAMIRIANFLVWRIAEHNKGAWAALLLLGTVVLGVADFLMKTR